jgi:hypothetical protein
MTRSRRLLALTAVVTATLALPGPPAGAAPAGTVQTHTFLRNLTLPADGPAVEEHLDVLLTSDRAGWAGEVTVGVDTSAIGTVADVAVESLSDGAECSAAGAVTRCTLPGPHRVYDPPENGAFSVIVMANVTISVTPKPGATVGTTGALTISARADDGPTTTRTSTVRIGEGVNLTAVDPGARTVAPGGSTALRPQVRNTGTRAVEGVTLVVSADETALADTDFGNCTYGYVVACTFDTTLAVGQTYRSSAPFTVAVPRDAAVGSRTGLSAQWLTLAEWEDWQEMSAGLPGGRQGTGPDLELSQLATAAAVPQADVDGDDNGTFAQVTVTGGRRLDVVAVGATVAGEAGETRTIEVGLVNRGPGTLHYPPFSNNLPGVYVTLPPGLSVVRADSRCASPFDVGDDPAGPPPSPDAEESWDSGPPLYACRADSVQLRPGQQLLYAFTVRVAPGAREGKGSVEVMVYDDEKGVDRDAGNNTAAIILSVGGAGGGLPVTGTAPALVAGSGILLVLFGAAVTVALRRRTRFTT